MPKKIYNGVNGVARNVKQPYIGVAAVARKVKSGYVGVAAVARQFWGGRTLAFTYDNASSGGTIWASVTLPNGRVIHHDNQIESVEVSVGDTLRIFVISEKSNTGGVYVNGVNVRSATTTGTYYDYAVTENATIDIDISQPGVHIRDPETGEITSSSPGYKRGLVTITELYD